MATLDENLPRWKDIAVIGMSGVFPGASSTDELLEALRAGQDSVGPVSTTRRTYSLLDLEADYPHGGYLERVDCFDHGYFGLSLREAELMDPQQRILLELSHAAVEDAGYRLEDVAGTNTAVVVGGRYSDYAQLLEQRQEATVLTGNLPGMASGRIAYLLDLRGPSLTIDTGCSSSLFAVYQACRLLMNGDAELAIVGSVNIVNCFPDPAHPGRNLGIGSSDGKCRPFDARSSGTVVGEGGGALVLKLLSAGLRDRDTVRAVIKGGATNHNGRRSTGLTAPSHQAQTELLLGAARSAGVPLSQVSYIEAHGTGTAIGDPIEYRAIRDALRAGAVPARRCAIGSLKSNLGHLDAAAGIAGAIKVILSLQHRQLFPSIHFQKLNPLIDASEDDPIRVQDTVSPWECDQQPRYAGVSSLSLTGSNVHLIFEQAPPRPPAAASASPVLLKLSARTEESLERYCNAVREHLENRRDSLHELSYTLNVGRGDYEYRRAVIADSRQAAVDALRQPAGIEANSSGPISTDRTIVLFFPETGPSAASLEAWSSHQAIREALGRFPGSDREGLSPAGTVAFQHAFYQCLIDHGLAVQSVIGVGTGRLTKQSIVDGLPVPEAMRRAAGSRFPPPSSDKLSELAATLNATASVVFVVGSGLSIGDRLRQASNGPPRWLTIALEEVGDPFTAVARAYCGGARVDWHRFHRAASASAASGGYHRVPAPTYAFARTRCWHLPARREKGSPPAPPAAQDRQSATMGRERIEARLQSLWREALGVQQVTSDDDFFELGGHSLIAVQLIDQIEREFDVRLDFDTFFGEPTIRFLGSRLHEALVARSPALPPIRPLALGNSSAASHAQKRLWVSDQISPELARYNLPQYFILRGSFDKAALRAAIDALITRHEALRTSFHNSEDGLMQRIQPTVAYDIKEVELLHLDAGDAELDLRLKQELSAPFHLDRAPLFRLTLFRLAGDRTIAALTMHHIITDGWSMRVLLRELGQIYDAIRAGSAFQLPELPITYRDYALWHNEHLGSSALSAQRDYWHQRLADAPRGISLTVDFEPNDPGFAGRVLVFDIVEAEALRQVARGHAVSTFTVLLAAFAVFLHKISGQTDLVIGTDMAGRIDAGLSHLVGCFVNTVVLRFHLDPRERVVDVFSRVKKRLAEAWDHQMYPYDLLVHELVPDHRSARNPLFNVFFSYQSPEAPSDNTNPQSIEQYACHSGVSRFDWEVQVIDTRDRLFMEVTYNPTVFRRRSMELLFWRYEMVLKGILSDPTQTMAAVRAYLAETDSDVLEEERF